MNMQEINELWNAFHVMDVDGNNLISTEELGQVMRSMGLETTDINLRDMMKEVDVDRSGSIDFDEFKAMMVSNRGDSAERLRLAFDVLDEDGNGQITTDELIIIMEQFGLTRNELNEMIAEVDLDGNGAINFDEFSALMPEEIEAETYKSYVPTLNTQEQPTSITTVGSTDISAHSSVADGQPTISTTTDTNQPGKTLAGDASSDAKNSLDTEDNSEVSQLKAELAKHPQGQSARGTSCLQMQIGLFRLIQGAAYRCFRESFSANHDTHLRVRNLPYRITDFVQFIQVAINLYKRLGVVDEVYHPLLDSVVDSVVQEYARLQERIEHWATIEKSPEMLAEEANMLAARQKSANVKDKFAAGVEFAISMKKSKLRLGDVVEGVLATNELNRLRQMELDQELGGESIKPSGGDPKAYLKKWNRVILTEATEEIDGAMMPISYWYEDFMPKLLTAFSVSRADQSQDFVNLTKAELDHWYEVTMAAGEFDQYGSDIAEYFPRCTPQQKLMIRQAWRLTRHYLNGIQKRREREEAGRESGALSQYVAFLDVFLGRSDVRDAGMRVSFPYYIGPGVWRFFHTTAEIVCTQTPEAQAAFVATFKDFFKLFATMYPCPYCRHHLNAYVVQNREVDMYPMEYLILGHDAALTHFAVSLDDKLSTVTDGPTLRLFLWKLHNTVSSSIARTEAWYHKNENAFYTTRYWPSLDAELAYATAFNHVSILSDRVARIYGLLKPAARLAGLTAELQRQLQHGDEEGIQDASIAAEAYVQELEQAVIEGNFLQETYTFDPDLVAQAPYFTPEEEEFGRSGVFVLA